MRKLVSIITCLMLSGCGSCKEEEPQAPETVAQTSEPDAGESDDAEPIHPLLKLRQAYGLPFPPEVVTVRKGPGYVAVQSELSLDEIEGFFRTRLVDYEFFRPHKTKLEIVGLREYMPRITATVWGARSPITVRYFEAPPDPSQEDAEDAEPQKPREKGDPILTRAKDGKLLAPGARWKMPYTPPPETPLHTESNRGNFGKPYGDWTLN